MCPSDEQQGGVTLEPLWGFKAAGLVLVSLLVACGGSDGNPISPTTALIPTTTPTPAPEFGVTFDEPEATSGLGRTVAQFSIAGITFTPAGSGSRFVTPRDTFDDRSPSPYLPTPPTKQ